MNLSDVAGLDWAKGEGLLPAVVQHADTGQVLMLGYMDEEALRATLSTRHVTFFSRSKQRLWVKGETSGHYLQLVEAVADCDLDTVLVKAHPRGPTCHTGAPTCFAEQHPPLALSLSFLGALERVIASRVAERPDGSYTARLFSQGTGRLAQKVGEEGVEVALAAVTAERDKVVSESADLMFHLMLLLKDRGIALGEVVAELEARHAGRNAGASAPPA